jgi:two-component system cell cycle sensor histidine kinase/response regulator CckA
MLRITDKGCGIPSDVKKFIFRPFFSTKAGRGIGLGLSTVWSIVTRFGGLVEVESKESVGTTVTVFLARKVTSDALSENLKQSNVIDAGNPQKIYDSPQTQSQTQAYSTFDSDKTILVVDDEELVRNAIAMSLRHLGYSVESAASGEEALEKLKSRQSPFLLAMVDIVMPYLGGDLVVREVRKRFPEMPVIVISGMWVPETVDDLLTHRATFFLRKPFTIRDLSSAIKKAILAATSIIQDTKMES